MSSEKQFSKNLEALVEKTSIHGLSNIFLSKRPFNKYFWLILFVIFSSLAIWFVEKNIIQYLKFDVHTELKVVRKNKLEFPTVTVCNLELCGFENYDFSTYLKKHKQNEETRLNRNNDNEIERNLREKNIKTNLFWAREVFLRKYDPFSLENVLKETSGLLERMLINCSFNQDKCSHEDFEFYGIGEFTKCFKFNSGHNIHNQEILIRNISRFDKNHGLTIGLKLGSDKKCNSPFTTTSGLAVYIHEPSYSLTEDDDAILVQPNTQVDIAMELTSVKKLPEPYSDCYKDLKLVKIEDKSLIEETIQLINVYTQQYCLQLCYQKFLIKNCDCYENFLYKFNPENVKNCTKFIDSLYTCQYLIRKLFYNGINELPCLSKCPKECEFVKYDSTVSSSATEYEYEESNDNMVTVNVYFKTGSITEITEKPAILFMSLISNLGGRGRGRGRGKKSMKLVLRLNLQFIIFKMLKNILQEKFDHWFDNTKLHGIPLIKISETKPVKTFWLICFFAAFTACASFLVKDLVKFSKHDVETVIKISRDTNFVFPTVSFCKLQLCNEEINTLDEEILIQKLNQTRQITSNHDLLSIPLPDIIKILLSDSVQKSNLTMISPLKNILISCHFSGDLCSVNDFEYFQLNEFQNCFRFNGNLGKPRLSRRSGKAYGLEMELFIGLKSKCFSPLPSTHGLSVYLHNASNFIGNDAYGVQLSTGTETNIAVDRTFISRKSKPYSNCIDQNNKENSQLVLKTFNYTGGYSQATCFKFCDQEFFIKNFGCYDRYLPFDRKNIYQECGNDKIEEIKETYYGKSLDKGCLKECPQECEYTKYDLTVSSSLFPTKTYSKIMMYNENISKNFDFENHQFENEYKKALTSVLSVKIYFKSDLVTNVRQKPKISNEVFISNIGGTLGLFLGLSLISVLEFIEFLIEILFDLGPEDNFPWVTAYIYNSKAVNSIITTFEIASKADPTFPTISICNLNTCKSREKNNCGNFDPSSTESIGDFLMECKFDGKKCNISDFFGFYLDNYRKCYQFNGHHTSIKRSRTGKSNGLNLKLEFNNSTNCCQLENMSLYVHNHPDWISEDLSGYLINYGAETDVAIERTLYTKKPKPYSNCVKDLKEKINSIYVSWTFRYIKTYVQQICIYLCFQDYLAKNLDCYDSDLPRYGDTKFPKCSDLYHSNMIKYKLSSSKQYDQCLTKCPIECELQTYRVTLSHLFYAYEREKDYKIRWENETKSSRRRVSLNVYYKSDIYTKVDEDKAMHFSDFLSNVGSTMGIVLGISVLSLAEIVNLILEIIMLLIEQRKNKNKQAKETNT
ncbi:amiloride-sensitive sodium channel subunit gamma-like [Brachionus plicatilis]|uniref:Amiloride-sensitive sodium channel subunit gamma-like n=1 Tax=Brachionus plicatilis TaxID=10195 RepID=A0A3M7RPY7_BRAPC|nr:amiloride-sensitive sodium channel subunit gamma-like [Brachionus plicatilis]